MQKTEIESHANGTRVAIITKMPHRMQIESIRMSSDSERYKELTELLRKYDPKPYWMQEETGKNASGIRVAIITKTPDGIKKNSTRLVFDSERYGKFMEWLRRYETKSWARQAGAENDILWEGHTPLL